MRILNYAMWIPSVCTVLLGLGVVKDHSSPLLTYCHLLFLFSNFVVFHASFLYITFAMKIVKPKYCKYARMIENRARTPRYGDPQP